jgi:hypothetical protein
MKIYRASMLRENLKLEFEPPFILILDYPTRIFPSNKHGIGTISGKSPEFAGNIGDDHCYIKNEYFVVVLQRTYHFLDVSSTGVLWV